MRFIKQLVVILLLMGFSIYSYHCITNSRIKGLKEKETKQEEKITKLEWKIEVYSTALEIIPAKYKNETLFNAVIKNHSNSEENKKENKKEIADLLGYTYKEEIKKEEKEEIKKEEKEDTKEGGQK